MSFHAAGAVAREISVDSRDKSASGAAFTASQPPEPFIGATSASPRSFRGLGFDRGEAPSMDYHRGPLQPAHDERPVSLRAARFLRRGRFVPTPSIRRDGLGFWSGHVILRASRVPQSPKMDGEVHA